MTEEIILTALERFKASAKSEQDFRKEAKIDMDFYTAKQWESGVESARKLDARPCLTINRLPQFVRQVTNGQRQNRPSIKIIPAKDGTYEIATILEGITRNIQNRSEASIAYDTACQNQVICGLGYIRVLTDYVDENSFDQEILIKRVKNPFSIYFDPSAVEPDYSDAKYAFVVEDIPKKTFKKLYPDFADSCDDETFISVGDEQMQWASEDAIRVAEYFSVEEKPVTKYLLIDGSVVSEKPADEALISKERKSVERKVMWRLITAKDVLSEQEWPGKYIPIVPVLGDDIDIGGKRSLKGMIRDARDSQRMYNYWASAQTEMIALAPKAPFIGAEGQFEGYENDWASANVKNQAYLVYKPKSHDGVVLGAPQRQTAEPPVQAMVGAMLQASEDLKATTGIYDASLGAKSNETSGKSIIARQKQGDIANYHFEDNLARSMNFVGKILLDLIPKIYDAPRVVRIMGQDDKEQEILINELFVNEDGQEVKYDLNIGRYDVVVEVGPTYKTKRQEASESMAMVLQSNPELWQTAGDIFIKALDWPNANELAERLKKMLPPELKDDDKTQLPPQVQAKMEEMMQMTKALTEQLNEAKSQLASKDAELQSKEKIAAMDNKTAIMIAELKNMVGMYNKDMEIIKAQLDKEMNDTVDSQKNYGNINNEQAVEQ